MTLKDIRDAGKAFHQGIELFGTNRSPQELEAEFLKLYREIGEALVEELKMTPREIVKLPLTTGLPLATTEKFNQLLVWMKENSFIIEAPPTDKPVETT